MAVANATEQRQLGIDQQSRDLAVDSPKWMFNDEMKRLATPKVSQKFPKTWKHL